MILLSGSGRIYSHDHPGTIQQVFRWEKPDRVPDMEFGYWDKTIAVWHEQGLPRECRTNRDVERHLGLEGLEIIPEAPVHGASSRPSRRRPSRSGTAAAWSGPKRAP